MNRTGLVAALSLFAIGTVFVPAGKADTLSLYNWGFNVDGTLYDKGNTSGSLPSGLSPVSFNMAGFNTTEGLGTITITVNRAADNSGPPNVPHFVDVYFDHDIRPILFGSDYSGTVGSVAAGESWEIGAGSQGGGAMLWSDFASNGGGSGYTDANNAPGPDDVATGLGFNFNLSYPYTGVVTITVSATPPSSGFYLEQWNTYSGSTPTEIYISGSEVNTLPEPSSWLLFGVPVVAFVWKMRNRLRLSKSAGMIALLAAVVLLGIPGAASANPVVKTVPWVPVNPVLPHYTWSGKVISLKGTTDQTAGTYTWVFGDGSSNATGSVTSANNYSLEATHAYTGSSGQVFTATLTVTNGTSTTTSYYVEIQPQTLAMEVNVAIDEGLWYLQKTMTRATCGSPAVNCGHWASGQAGSTYGGNTAENTNAFQVSGHLQTGASTDPYTETVTRGFNYALNQLAVTTVTALNGSCNVTNQIGAYNDCLGDANHYAIYENDGNSEPMYQGGMYMDMIVGSQTPTATAATGPAGVAGRQLQNIMQDMMDYYFYCQWYTSSPGGGWRYSCRDTTGPDNSPCQWAAIGILAGARSWGLTVPANVINANLPWLKYSQYAPTGEFGYQQPNSYAWTQYATTPSGLVQLCMDGYGRGQSYSGQALWDLAENYLRVNFTNVAAGGYALRNYYYGMFSFTKSMHYHAPGGVATPITFLHAAYTAGYPDIDWYGDPTYGVAATLIGTQTAVTAGEGLPGGGYWTGQDYTSTQYSFETAEAITMLQATVVALLPVAVATGTPNPQLPNQNVTFSGSGSYDQNPAASIVSWQWDFTGGTNFTASGVSVTNSWPAPGTYNVRLRVTDNQSPAQTADTVIAEVIEPPVAPPTANPAGPYTFCPETTPWTLNGTASVDPQAGQSTTGTPSAILSYGWAINGDNNFADATGATPNVTALLSPYIPGSAGSGNTINVSLKVTDNDLAAYNIPNESSIATTQVTVHNSLDAVCSPCSVTLNGRVKPRIGSNPSEVSLWWSPVTGATSYQVYRGTTSGGPYTYIGLGSTVGPYVAFLDNTLNSTGTYYYTTQPYNASGSMCTSNQVTEVVVQQIAHKQ